MGYVWGLSIPWMEVGMSASRGVPASRIKAAYELLLKAPESQVARCRIALHDVISGSWPEAAFKLGDAARETEGAWADEAAAFAALCNEQAKKES